MGRAPGPRGRQIRPMTIHPCVRAPAAAALALLAFASPIACKQSPTTRVGPSAQRYTVRGEVVGVQGSGGNRSFVLRHESIPDFVDASGAKVGMAPMTMTYRVGPGASDAEAKPGDKVRFRFAMDWKTNAMELESLERLPPDTALELGQ